MEKCGFKKILSSQYPTKSLLFFAKKICTASFITKDSSNLWMNNILTSVNFNPMLNDFFLVKIIYLCWELVTKEVAKSPRFSLDVFFSSFSLSTLKPQSLLANILSLFKPFLIFLYPLTATFDLWLAGILLP
jgi:hypothetical protein